MKYKFLLNNWFMSNWDFSFLKVALGILNIGYKFFLKLMLFAALKFVEVFHSNTSKTIKQSNMNKSIINI